MKDYICWTFIVVWFSLAFWVNMRFPLWLDVKRGKRKFFKVTIKGYMMEDNGQWVFRDLDYYRTNLRSFLDSHSFQKTLLVEDLTEEVKDYSYFRIVNEDGTSSDRFVWESRNSTNFFSVSNNLIISKIPAPCPFRTRFLKW